MTKSASSAGQVPAAARRVQTCTTQKKSPWQPAVFLQSNLFLTRPLWGVCWGVEKDPFFGKGWRPKPVQLSTAT